MNFKLFITCLLVGLFQWATAQEFIPSWFEKLPDAPAGLQFSVGYSGKFNQISNAKSAAVKLACKNMAKQISIRLQFDIEELADGRLRLLNPSFKESYEGQHLNAVEDNYSIVDSSITSDGYYVLLAYPARDNLRLNDATQKTWGARPDWIENLPDDDDFIYGIGMVARYRSWTRAWYDADEYARFDLGKNLQITAESIFASRRDNRTTIESVILKQSYDLILKNATVIARWHNTQNDAYYSLCRAPRQ